MDIHEIVKKLIGEIKPVGETNEDNNRLENLKKMCKLIEEIYLDIEVVAYGFKNNQQYSIKKSSQFAKEFLDKITKQ